MPQLHLQGPISEWPQNVHDILDDDSCILCFEEWPVITEFWSLEPLAGGLL
jgi:hypothetical protein